MFNATLADAVLAQIDQDTKSWEQGSWIAPKDPADDDYMIWNYPEADDQYNGEPVTMCGAKLCYAGHTALLAGWVPTRDAFRTFEVVNPKDGTIRDIPSVAADELGIHDSATPLFNASSTREQLGAIVDAYRWGGDESDAYDARDASAPKAGPCPCGCGVDVW